MGLVYLYLVYIIIGKVPCPQKIGEESDIPSPNYLFFPRIIFYFAQTKERFKIKNIFQLLQINFTFN